MFSFVFFGFNHVFLTGITAAKNNIQLQPYSSMIFSTHKKSYAENGGNEPSNKHDNHKQNIGQN